MTVQAAIDGIGVAMGRTSYVEADIAKGRLVVPFKIALPADAGFYLVSPEGVADPPKLRAFRQWLLASAQEQGLKYHTRPLHAPYAQARRDFRLVAPLRAWQIVSPY